MKRIGIQVRQIQDFTAPFFSFEVNAWCTWPMKTQVDVQNIIVSNKVTENRGAPHLVREQVHALICEHKIISKHPQNMRLSLIITCMARMEVAF